MDGFVVERNYDPVRRYCSIPLFCLGSHFDLDAKQNSHKQSFSKVFDLILPPTNARFDPGSHGI